MPALRPCLWLTPDEAEMALDLYTSLVPDTRVVGSWHVDNHDMPEHGVDIHHLDVAGTQVQIMACARYSDFTDAVSMYLVVDDQATLDRVWDGFIAAGGEEVQCGWVRDPFGVRWQVVPKVFEELTSGDDQEQRQRVVEAVWGMVRIDAAALEAAARG